MEITDLTKRKPEKGKTYELYAVDLHSEVPRNCVSIKFSAESDKEAVDAIIKDLTEDGHENDYFPAKLFDENDKDITKKLSDALFDSGVIKLVPVKESRDMPDAYTVQHNQMYPNSGHLRSYGTFRTKKDAETMRRFLAKQDPEHWALKDTEVVFKDLDPMLPVHWDSVDGLDEYDSFGESTKITLTIGQLKRLVKESR